MKSIVENFVELPRSLRKPLWRVWHNMILGFDKDRTEIFLNYGYAGTAEEFDYFQLEEKDVKDKFGIQLYAHVTRHHHFPGTDVLEVGSGRGGGAYFLSRYLKPNSYTALDINANTVAFCNQNLKASGLKFVQGDAENLPFHNHTFDAVVNVESARCYGNIPKFMSEVKRVLKPGGRFLFTDMIKPADYDKIKGHLDDAGFECIEIKNILPNVVESLRQDSKQRKDVIDKRVPKMFRKAFYEFAGVEGSGRFKAFDTQIFGYWSFSLVKPK